MMRGKWYMAKKELALVLSLALMLGGIDLPARAAEDGAEAPEVIVEESEEKDAIDLVITVETPNDEDIWTLGTNGKIGCVYDADSKTLTVSGNDALCGGRDYALNSSYSPFKEICEKKTVERIVFKSCKLSGSAYGLFANLSSVQEIDVSEINISDVTDMSCMFYSCSSLTSLDVSNWDTSNVTNMESMFADCGGLMSLDVSNWDTSSVTNMQAVFRGCGSLTDLDVSNWDTSDVTDMGWMFSGCSSLTSLDVSGFDTSKVTHIYNMFEKCSSLTSLDVSSFDTSKVIGASSMFSGCSGLGSLDVSGFNTSNMTGMRGMFYDCSSLPSLNVSNWDTGNVTDMTGIFESCSGLTSLDVSNWDTSNVKAMWSMFTGCSSLTSLDVSNWDTSSLTEMAYMFSYCSSLTSLDVSNWNMSNAEAMFNMFYGCHSLTSLDVSNWDTSNVTCMQLMFWGCGNLASLDVSNWDTSNVIYMYNMFYGCGSLTSLDVSNWDTGKVTDMSCMFYSCNSLTSLDVSNWDTGKVTDMKYMFFDCGGLTSLDVSNWDTDKVTDMDNMLGQCNHLHTLKSPQIPAEINLYLPALFYDEDGTRYERTISAGTPSKTLTTVKLSEAYTVCFDNNLSGKEHATATQLIKHGAESQMLYPNLFQRKGYRFVKWTTDPDGSGTSYTDEQSVTDLAAVGKSITLYAQWEYAQYSITYHLDDGTNAVSNPSVYALDTDTIILASPTREGYVFGGWYRNEAMTIRVTQIPKGSAGDLELYAKWTEKQGVATYTIQYNGNGATSGTMTAQTDCACGEKVTLKKNVFERTGYVFKGWTISQNGSGNLYEDETEVDALADTDGATVTLYAQWEKEVVAYQYTITYHLDGGTPAASNPAGYNEIKTAVALAAPSKNGYTFAGWYDNAEFNGEKITAIAVGTIGNLNFYAKWTVHTYTVKFDGNGATEGAMEDLAGCVYGTKYALKENGYKRANYTFAGWTTNKEGTGTSYADKAEVQNLTAENNAAVTLYAQWKPVKYTITYHLDGGAKPASNPAEYDITTETITLSAPTKDGYSFEGWYADAAFTTEVKVIAKGSVGDKVLYAKWRKLGKYSVSYQLNGGTNAASNPTRYDDTTTPVELADAVRTGYDFAGWYSDIAYKNRVTTLKNTDTGNIILRAKWTAHKYTISFNKGDSAATGKINALKNCVYDTSYELPANKFTYKNHVFLGWGRTEDGTDVAFRDCENVKNLRAENGSVTLYARWLDLTENNAYGITYRLNGGVNNAENPAYYTKGSEVVLKEPTRAGYKFEGWYTKSNLRQGKTESIAADSKGKKTFYAKWSALSYTIKFKGNPTGITQGNSNAASGTGGVVENSMADMTGVKSGKKVALKPNKFCYTGYTFQSWNTKPDGSGKTYKNKASVKDLALLEDGTFADTITLYAQWTETKYTISSDTITLAEPTRRGYSFEGWYTTSKCRAGTEKATINTGSKGKVTLYAKWKKVKK